MTTIIIEWERVNFKNFLKGINDDGKKRDDEYGLYQIYSTHLIYGANSLVYIGKAYDQPILNRIKNHQYYWLDFESDEVSLFIGRFIVERKSYETLSKEEIDQYWKDQVSIAEKLLIFNCAPSYNSSSIVDYGIKDREIILFNYGKRGQLPLEISTLYDKSIYWHKGNGGDSEKKSEYIDVLYNEKDRIK